MARKCPNCFATVPAAKVLAYTDDLVCPSCNSPLEVSALSRNISVFVGLIVAAIFWRISSEYYSENPGSLGWVLRIVLTYLVYSISAPFVLAFIADLKLRLLEMPAVVADAKPHHHPSH